MTRSVEPTVQEVPVTECRQSTNLSPTQTFAEELLAQGACIDRVVNENIPLDSVLVKKSYFAVKIPSGEPIMERLVVFYIFFFIYTGGGGGTGNCC